MASSSGPNIPDHEALVESLKEIVEKDAQMAKERAKLLNALKELTRRYEQLLAEQKKLKIQHEGDQDMQCALTAALEKQNGLLREVVIEKEDEITELEKEILRLKAGGNAETVRAEGSGVRDAEKKSKTAEKEAKPGAKSLLNAARNGKTAEVKALISKGTYMDARDSLGFTALMHASRSGYYPIVQMLLSRGANLDAKSNNNTTALILAISKKHSPIIGVLIQAGANVNVISTTDGTALDCAVDKDLPKVATKLKAAGAKMAREL